MQEKENNELYFDYKRDNMADKFPGLTCEELEELGIITLLSIDEDNSNIGLCDIRNITVEEAIKMGIISEDYIS